MKQAISSAAILVLVASGCSAGGTGSTGDIGQGMGPSRIVSAGSGTGFTVTVLPSLGGTSSAANTINSRGQAMGTSFLSGNTTMHAALWRSSGVIDLGTLGGPNSAVEWPVENDAGYVSGIAETFDARSAGRKHRLELSRFSS